MSPPEIAWTGIGSLPFSDESEALKHALSAYPRRPFVPELDRPEASGGMLAAVLPPLPLIAGGGFGVRVALSGTDPALAEAFLPTELAVSQTPLLRFWNGFLPGLSAAIGSTGVKAQLCGPVTLLRCVRDQYSRALGASPALTEPVAAWSRALSRAAAAKLLAHTSRVWLALDEPALGLDVDDEERATAATILHAAMDDLRDSGVRAGLHCCSPPPFDRLDRIRPDWLSFDLVRFGVDAREHAGGLSDFLSAGGELLLGVLPPLPRDDDPDPLTLIDDFVAALRGQGADADSLARLSLSPSCGTLLAPKSRERQVAARLAELARHLEERIAQP